MSNNKLQKKNISPKVSIIIPVYNGANYLGEAIDSALAQTYLNKEIIVVNDGSTDNGETRNIALKYGTEIFYLEKKNGGVASALNYGIRNMSGEYFSWLSHDDLYVENKLAKQIDYIGSNNLDRNSILYGNSQILFENEYRNIIRAKPIIGKSLRFSLTMNNLISGCSFLIPRSAFDYCDLFDEKLLYTQDNAMWFRLAGSFNFYHIDEVLVFTRVHKLQTGKMLHNQAQWEADKLKCYFINELNEKDFLVSQIRWWNYFPILIAMVSSGYNTASQVVYKKMVNLGFPPLKILRFLLFLLANIYILSRRLLKKYVRN
jgi:glycosyltransferase involved in cell wall biosynthesis